MDPTSKLTYADMHVGIPILVNCLQIVPISIFFHYAYTFRPYVVRKGEHAIHYTNAGGQESVYVPEKRYQGGFLGYRALLGALNPIEVFEGVFFAFKSAIGSAGNQRDHTFRGGESENMLASQSQYVPVSPQPSHAPEDRTQNPTAYPKPGLGYGHGEQGQGEYQLEDYRMHGTGNNRRRSRGRRRGGPITMLVGYLADRASGR